MKLETAYVLIYAVF